MYSCLQGLGFSAGFAARVLVQFDIYIGGLGMPRRAMAVNEVQLLALQQTLVCHVWNILCCCCCCHWWGACCLANQILTCWDCTMRRTGGPS
jgi:hypothetical protein